MNWEGWPDKFVAVLMLYYGKKGTPKLVLDQQALSTHLRNSFISEVKLHLEYYMTSVFLHLRYLKRDSYFKILSSLSKIFFPNILVSRFGDKETIEEISKEIRTYIPGTLGYEDCAILIENHESTKTQFF